VETLHPHRERTLGCANIFDQLVADASNCSPSVAVCTAHFDDPDVPSGAIVKRRSGGALAKLSTARNVGMRYLSTISIVEVESGSSRRRNEADHSVVAVPFRALVTTVGVMVVQSRTVEALEEGPLLEQWPTHVPLLQAASCKLHK